MSSAIGWVAVGGTGCGAGFGLGVGARAGTVGAGHRLGEDRHRYGHRDGDRHGNGCGLGLGLGLGRRRERGRRRLLPRRGCVLPRGRCSPLRGGGSPFVVCVGDLAWLVVVLTTATLFVSSPEDTAHAAPAIATIATMAAIASTSARRGPRAGSPRPPREGAPWPGERACFRCPRREKSVRTRPARSSVDEWHDRRRRRNARHFDRRAHEGREAAPRPKPRSGEGWRHSCVNRAINASPSGGTSARSALGTSAVAAATTASISGRRTRASAPSRSTSAARQTPWVRDASDPEVGQSPGQGFGEVFGRYSWRLPQPLGGGVTLLLSSLLVLFELELKSNVRPLLYDGPMSTRAR